MKMHGCAVKLCSACGESTSNIEKSPEKCFFKYPNTLERKLEWIFLCIKRILRLILMYIHVYSLRRLFMPKVI
jgi:hypothetical protein